ncbi:hypothetical protein DFJ58DRAFT_848499 [Suillus subalutaceus]|uniref:uncharacterized protein n=1 Tax=Suillus subalutaceus TaxID=48586 RepID=UPI001B869020|nr:uncharacterized protein DFJ58DRAFT_848499 [Suillus subalutaceus]KAG1830266.1 hypothetical protein DFJ58DRAFT_848499 [Suillus subalutaceus]
MADPTSKGRLRQPWLFCERPRPQIHIGQVGHRPAPHRLLDSYSEMGFCEASPSLNTTAPFGRVPSVRTCLGGSSVKKLPRPESTDGQASMRGKEYHCRRGQAVERTVRRSQPGWADMKYLKMLNQYKMQEHSTLRGLLLNTEPDERKTLEVRWMCESARRKAK